MKTLLLLFLLCINYSLFSQIKTFSGLLEEIKSKSDFTLIRAMQNKPEIVFDLNFQTLTYSKFATSGKKKYLIHKFNDELVKVEFQSKKVNYSLIRVANFDSLNVFVIDIKTKTVKVSNFDGYVDGLFVVDKKLGFSYYFNCQELMDSCNRGNFMFNPNSSTLNIISIFLITKDFKPETRLNFKDNLGFTYSTFNEINKAYRETLYISLNNGYVNLANDDLTLLYHYLEYGLPKTSLICQTYVKYNENLPMFLFPSRNYGEL